LAAVVVQITVTTVAMVGLVVVQARLLEELVHLGKVITVVTD
jgi:hypothetical protein